LARLGTKVLGIDRYKPPHEFGSSTGETRLTRVAVGEGVEYSPLALRSNEIWREIETRTGQTLFVQCGCLTITGHPNKSMVHGVNKFFDNIEASAERYNAGVASKLRFFFEARRMSAFYPKRTSGP
jgi:sarcosine oxidase